ncbi:inorganic phosphate transporter Pho88 [Fimicolochytrium jonesii]|uniref:inorganic phosphate transporter Pho88 n=1 Tax=Fimicolochytrium jonesii TaxID=1396493 RepID=UPI0022FECAE3|nr:inorganic phosphate transporter Pho88 [Fimicolochytrium jonesii]KAI8825279.1 inorganic phosphate transporter Pho88 [Fimicolochytrium jonesii]
MNPAITNLIVVFGLMQVANKFELDKEENTPYLRAAYLGMQIISVIVWGLIYSKVVAANDQTPLVYTEAANALDPSNTTTIRTTVKDYDIKKIIEQLRSQAIAAAILGLMHFKFGYLRPLLLQSILGFKALYSTQLVQIHLLGKQPVAELVRPWKAANPFGETVKPTTEKEIKAKEKREAKKKANHQD